MPIGHGTLRVTLEYPSWPFTRDYRTSTLRLSVDDVEHRDVTWGTHYLTLPAGPHTLEISVYAETGDAFGRARSPVTIGLGKQTSLTYRAPRFQGARGRIEVCG